MCTPPDWFPAQQRNVGKARCCWPLSTYAKSEMDNCTYVYSAYTLSMIVFFTEKSARKQMAIYHHLVNVQQNKVFTEIGDTGLAVVLFKWKAFECAFFIFSGFVT